MENKIYFGERTGVIKQNKYDFAMLKRLFLNLYIGLDDECNFQEATGHYCTDGNIRGYLGQDIAAAIFLKTGLEDVWPISNYIENYDEAKLFTIIEFLYDHVSAPKDKYYHNWNDCGWHATKFNKEEGQNLFFKEINKLLDRYENDYYLTKTGEIHNVSPDGLTVLVEKQILSGDAKNIDDRVQYAISKFLKYNSSIAEKKDAVRTLGVVLEFYQKQGIKLENKDDSDLFNIINGFDLRHHNKAQQSYYDKDFWYEWLFYTFLASINVLVKLQKGDLSN